MFDINKKLKFYSTNSFKNKEEKSMTKLEEKKMSDINKKLKPDNTNLLKNEEKKSVTELEKKMSNISEKLKLDSSNSSETDEEKFKKEFWIEMKRRWNGSFDEFFWGILIPFFCSLAVIFVPLTFIICYLFDL